MKIMEANNKNKAKRKYKVFTFAVPSKDYELYKEFFKGKGGFSRFIRETIENEGLKRKIELIKSAKAIKKHSLKEYEDLEGTIDDGI